MALAEIYLLDTNIVSDMMRAPEGAAAQRASSIARQAPGCRIVTSIVVQCQILFGLKRVRSTRWMDHYASVMRRLEVLPLDSEISSSYADMRVQLERAGTPIGPNDCFIAAHALALGATLVSADAEFTRVPGLSVENWLT